MIRDTTAMHVSLPRSVVRTLAPSGAENAPRGAVVQPACKSHLAHAVGGYRVVAPATTLSDITNVSGAGVARASGRSPRLSGGCPPGAAAPRPSLGKAPGAQGRPPRPSVRQPRGEAPQEGAAEYAADVLATYVRREATAERPAAGHLDAQQEVTPNMRAILVDWLVDVHRRYGMKTETLHLTVNIVDRFLSARQVRRRQMQLIGVVALLIASKYEETYTPRVVDMAYITADTYTTREILDMECFVLAAIGFELGLATPAHFLHELEAAAGCGDVQRSLVHYLVELAAVEAHMCRHQPSKLVSAAILLSGALLNRRPAWPPSVARVARHTEASLRAVCEELRMVLAEAPRSPQQCVRTKYKLARHHAVADLPCCRQGQGSL